MAVILWGRDQVTRDVERPTPGMYGLHHTAQVLSHLCRFGGRIPVFYSVLSHVCECALEALARYPRDYTLALACLHHDDHEAWLGDVCSPLKPQWPWLIEVSELHDRVIEAMYGVDLRDPRVAEIDHAAFTTEADLLYGGVAPVEHEVDHYVWLHRMLSRPQGLPQSRLQGGW